MGFNGVRFTCLRIIKFGMSAFSRHINNVVTFKNLYYLRNSKGLGITYFSI